MDLLQHYEHGGEGMLWAEGLLAGIMAVSKPPVGLIEGVATALLHGASWLSSVLLLGDL